MSTPEPRQALYAYLLANNGVKDVVGDRIHQGRIPTGAAKPLLLIQPPISRVSERYLRGVAYKRTRLQVTAIADTQGQAEQAANAVISAVEGFVGSMSGVTIIEATVDNDRQIAQDGIDETHHHVDVMVMYKG